MSKGNRKFVENSIKKAFIKRLEKLGIDPQTVDLAMYDFYSFENLEDLLQFYARHGDELCKKLVSGSVDSYYSVERFAHEYKNYLESLDKQNHVDKLEKIETELGEVSKRLMLLEDKFERLHNLDVSKNLSKEIIEEINKLKDEVITIKQKSGKDLENVISKVVNEVNGIKMQLEQLKPKPNVQTTLFSHGPPERGHEVGDVEIEIIPEHDVKPNVVNTKANNKIAKKQSIWASTGFLRAIIIHVMGLFLSYIISDMSGVSMFFTYLIFIAVSWLDAITWLPLKGPSRRGFATGYMYSQYTNPYRMGRGR